MSNAVNRLSSQRSLFAVAVGALGVSGCASDSNDLITSASTAGTTAYLIHEENEADDFARARDFADQRMTALRRDAAAGDGEHLRAFAMLMHAADPSAFGRWMQTHYDTLFRRRTLDPSELVTRIRAMRGMDATL